MRRFFLAAFVLLFTAQPMAGAAAPLATTPRSAQVLDLPGRAPERGNHKGISAEASSTAGSLLESRAVAPSTFEGNPRSHMPSVKRDWTQLAVLPPSQIITPTLEAPTDPLDYRRVRAYSVPAIAPPAGIRVEGPPMLRRPIDPRNAPADPHALRATMPKPTLQMNSPNMSLRPVVLVPPQIGSQPVRPQNKGETNPVQGNVVNIATPSTTGINDWWTYAQEDLPGIGKAIVNIANGNLVVQSADMAVPHKGVPFSFDRTYNSQSKHDSAGSDGSIPSNYGNGWTNEFDAHVAQNSAGGLSVFDLDGARYDYAADGKGGWTPPPGQHAQLAWDGANGYFWIKTNGIVYYFYTPYQSTTYAGQAGRLLAIFGRNHNCYLLFGYSWDGGNATSASKLNQVNVYAEGGSFVRLNFADFNGHRLLAQLTYPDQATIVTYGYDANANLTQVSKPTNNLGVPLVQAYGWSGFALSFVAGPRWNVTPAGSDGGYTWFNYDVSNRISSVQHIGSVNFTPNDGTNSLLQPGVATGIRTYAQTSLRYNFGSTVISDTDGHTRTDTYDSSGRLTQAAQYTGSKTLTSSFAWDSANDLLLSTDARGNEIDYAYDNNGNLIEQALPLVASSQGNLRPTDRYSYDTFNNITAFCDAVFDHQNGYDWTARPPASDSLCPVTGGATRYTWDETDPNEPFGRLTDSQTPMNYHAHLTYDPASQGGTQFGLLTAVAGDGFTQIDNTTRWTPIQTFTYDALGNVTGYSNGSGAWTATYDVLNRPIQTTDPDGVRSFECYYHNGQLQGSSTAAQFNLDGSACGAHANVHTYDANGNEATQTRHFNNQSSVTNKWYDAADRLIEVGLPWTTDYAMRPQRDYYSFRWLTRYLYDLGQGAGQLFNGQVALVGHGNLIKTQEYLGNENQTWVPGATSQFGPIGWKDVRGNSYDALDRAVTKLAWVQGAAQHGAIQQWNATFDAGGFNGLLSSACDPLQQCTTPTYDSADRLFSVSFSGGGTPSRSYAYDPDSRIYSIQSSLFGLEKYVYDADGRLYSKSEASGGGFSNASTLTYAYYPNGVRSALSVTSTALTQPNLLSYVYRTDGALSQQSFNWDGQTASLSFGYSNAGRAKSRTDTQRDGSVSSYAYGYVNEGLSSATGQLGFMTIPQGSYGQMQYDPENEKTSYAFGQAPNWLTATTSFNVRGEIVAQTLPGGSMNESSLSANGYMVPNSAPYSQTIPSTTFDAYMGVMTDRQSDDSSGGSSDDSVAFDVAGRQITQAQSYTSGDGGTNSSGALSRSYDAENHIASAAYTTWPIPGPSIRHSTLWNTTFAYKWGSNGHPAMIGSGATPSYDSLHWDGDSLLFTTTANGQVDDIKIGPFADYTPLDTNYKKVTFWDRDPAGSTVACHNTNGAAAVQFPNWLHQTVVPCGSIGPSLSIQYALAKTIGQGGILWSPGPDGYSDGDVVLQGDRTFDPQLGTWTTPDAAAGHVNDPMSQQPYTWNGNNSTVNSDPSGFDAINQCPDTGCTGCPAGQTCYATSGGCMSGDLNLGGGTCQIGGGPLKEIGQVWFHWPNWNLTGMFMYQGFSSVHNMTIGPLDYSRPHPPPPIPIMRPVGPDCANIGNAIHNLLANIENSKHAALLDETLADPATPFSNPLQIVYGGMITRLQQQAAEEHC